MHGGNAPCSVGNWLVAAGYIGDDGRDPPGMVSVGLLGPFCSGRVGRGESMPPNRTHDAQLGRPWEVGRRPSRYFYQVRRRVAVE